MAAEHPRLCGYYLIGLMDISDEHGRATAEVLDEALELLDDQDWPPPEQRPQDQTWLDYRVGRAAAHAHMLESLIGGNNIGHTKPTMSVEVAEEMWALFLRNFADEAEFLTGMSLGDSEHVFLVGVAAFDHQRVGVLCIAESD